MKSIIFRLSISLLTFAIGFSVVWLWGLFAVLVSLFEAPHISLPNSLSNNSAQITSFLYEKPRFVKTFRGCGLGYVQGYETDDGQHLTEGNRGFQTQNEARNEFKKRIAKAVRIIENAPKYQNQNGEMGERVILINPPDERNAKETVSILWYSDGEFITFINAPSLEMAFEFEQFLVTNNFAAH